jgi:hypothetical protein
MAASAAAASLWGKDALSRKPLGLTLDPEIPKFATSRLPCNLDVFDSRARWPTPAPSDPFFELVPVTFCHGLHCATGAISHPSGEAEIFRGVNCGSAKVNALNPAMDRQMGAGVVLIGWHWAIFSARAVVLQYGSPLN